MATVAVLGVLGWSASAASQNPGNPASEDAEATVQVLELIEIVEHEALDFGKITPPAAGSQTFTVDPNNGSMTVGAGTGQAVSGHLRGRYDVLGEDGRDYFLDADDNSCTNVSLVFEISLSTPGSVPRQLDDLDVYVGGILTVGAGVPAGSHECSYSLTASYL